MPIKAQRLKTFIPTSVTDNLMVGDYGVVVHTNLDLDLDLFLKNKNKEPGHVEWLQLSENSNNWYVKKIVIYWDLKFKAADALFVSGILFSIFKAAGALFKQDSQSK